MSNCLWIFHRWGVWREYQHKATRILNAEYSALRSEVPFVEVRQKRRCLRCGFTQDRHVKAGPLSPMPVDLDFADATLHHSPNGE